MVLPQIKRHGPIEAWIIDDTGFPEKGRQSVGIARQYGGQLGEQDNCQVALRGGLVDHRAPFCQLRPISDVAAQGLTAQERARHCEDHGVHTSFASGRASLTRVDVRHLGDRCASSP